MALKLSNPDTFLMEEMGKMSKDPLRWVIFSFPWGSGELEKFTGPEEWQKKVLEDIRDGLVSAEEAIRIARASGHGIGKSCLVAWIILWSLSTFEDTRGIVTANTENQLKTKTWAELSKWYHMFIAKHWFVMTATALYSADPEHERTWRIDMLPWSENKTEAFAGMHNKGKRIVVIFDEASAIPNSIWEVTEGALTDEGTEILWIVFGNPTRNDGAFRECFTKFAHRWSTAQIDSRHVTITNKEQIDKWITDYGDDSDFVRVRVRGEFPNVSDRQFIPSSYVQMARGRHLRENEYIFAPKIIGVDPAWSGEDETVIVLRQGNYARIIARYRRMEDDFKVAGYVAKLEDEEKASAVFIDLGYGTGIKSAGLQFKRNWVLIPFGGASGDPGFANKRAQMWNDMKTWLKDGGAIPDDPTLAAELIGPEYYVVPTGPRAGKIVLESKADMKKRGIGSPNIADALALTFAYPVMEKDRWKNPMIPGLWQNDQEFAIHEYDVLKGV